MQAASLRQRRLSLVREAFATLPERYLGAEEGYRASVEIRLEDVGRCWEVQLHEDRCKVSVSGSRNPDVVIGTDSATWLALRDGRMSGLDAFSSRRLWARGDLDKAVGFEGHFHLPDERSPLLRMHSVRVKGASISSLTAGTGPEHVILIHGLGGAKSSFYETVSALTPDYTVHAIDLPGFGSSSKPLRARYDANFFARHVLRFMDTLALDRAHIVGNSMGGRVALEVGLQAPGRVRTLSLLAPSMAFLRGREWSPLVRLLRPEMAVIPHALGSNQVRRELLEHDRRAAPGRPGRRRHRRGRVPPHLPLAARTDRLLRGGAQHLPRKAPRARRLLDAPRGPRAARDVHLGRQRPPRPRPLLTPRQGDPPRRARRSSSRAAATYRRSSCPSAPTP